ncbi:MAG: HEAT repeat domain-containing protein [bacterium]
MNNFKKKPVWRFTCLLLIVLFPLSCKPRKKRIDMEELENQLFRGDKKTRLKAAKLLADGKAFDKRFYQSNQALYLIFRALKDKDYEVRAYMAIALCHIKTSTSVKVLLKLLDDQHYQVKVGALKGLGSIHHPQSLEPIFYMIKDTNSKVRIAAIRAANQFKGEKVTRRLIKSLKDIVPTVRIATATSLGKRGDPIALEALEKSARRKNRQVAEKAREAIELIKQKQRQKKLAATGKQAPGTDRQPR